MKLVCARKNGINDIIEHKIGFDGIVVANSNNGPSFNISRKDLYLALAAKVPCGTQDEVTCINESVTWRDVNSSLPDIKIEVYGPPPTSGTRDAFVELALEADVTLSLDKKLLKERQIFLEEVMLYHTGRWQIY